MILDNLRRFGQLYIIFALTIICYVYHSHCQLYKAKLSTYELTLSNIKSESAALAKRIQLAQSESVKVKIDHDKQIKTILSMQVPTHCEDAIKWGINQAKLF